MGTVRSVGAERNGGGTATPLLCKASHGGDSYGRGCSRGRLQRKKGIYSFGLAGSYFALLGVEGESFTPMGRRAGTAIVVDVFILHSVVWHVSGDDRAARASAVESRCLVVSQR